MKMNTKVKYKKIGRAVFKNLSKNDQNIIKQSGQIQKLLTNQQWRLQQEIYQTNNFKHIFSKMSKFYALNIYICNNWRAEIISQIQNVNYVNLKQLYLFNNSINNLQTLTLINFNSLQKLDLSFNSISQIKGLNKLSISSLKQIEWISNPIKELNALTKSKINPKQFKVINFRHQIISYPHRITQDLSIIVKLNTKLVKTIITNSVRRIRQFKIKSMFTKNVKWYIYRKYLRKYFKKL